MSGICVHHHALHVHCPACYRDALKVRDLEARLWQAELRLTNMEFAWKNLRDSPQATPDIRAVAVGFVGEKKSDRV